MKLLNICFASTLLFCSVFSYGETEQQGAVGEQKNLTVFLVRHAEKLTQGRDPELAEAGKKRAQQLSKILADAGLDKVYSTDFLRTRDTATPTAKLYGLDVEIYDYRQMDSFVEQLQESGGRYLIVGHSNTTPEMVKLLGGEPGSPIKEKSEFDRLYVLSINGKDEVNTLLLRYGQ